MSRKYGPMASRRPSSGHRRSEGKFCFHFRVEVCGARNWFDYVDGLQRR
jgi:hypothetical protein